MLAVFMSRLGIFVFLNNVFRNQGSFIHLSPILLPLFDYYYYDVY